ncbi:MAG: serine/threonine-protein kinase [Myxococcota bacterium]
MAHPATHVDVTDFDDENDTSVSAVPQEVSHRRFGRYRLNYKLASGGMATVFLGKEIGPAALHRAVAIKRIHDHLADQKKFLDMFLDEARIVARISHPNVCTVLDFGEVDGAYYLAMEYLLGESFRAVVREVTDRPDLLSSMRWRALAARIIADAAEGLHAAHQLRDDDGAPMGVVHRDVSLSNLFVTYVGAVKVIDFGIAKAATKNYRTRTGEVKGTYAYMAPEQFLGAELDCRADVWSLGVCLFEACTGTRLFRRDTQMETMMAVCSQPIPDPRERQPDLPEGLAEVINRAVSRDRDDRYPSARAMGQALSHFLVGIDEATGLPELEEWMQQLFDRSRTTKQGLRDSVLAEPKTEELHSADLISVASPPKFAPVRSSIRTVRRPVNVWMVVTAGLAVALVATLVVLGVVVTREPEPVVEAPEPSSLPPLLSPRSSEPALGHSPTVDRSAEVEAASDEQPSTSVATDSEPASVVPALATPEPAPRMAPPPRSEGRVAPVNAEPVAFPAAMDPSADHAVGYVNVTTPGGWADIYSNGQRLGRTPRRVELRAGRRLVVLRPFGRLPEVRRTIQVEPRGVTRLVVSVSP